MGKEKQETINNGKISSVMNREIKFRALYRGNMDLMDLPEPVWHYGVPMPGDNPTVVHLITKEYEIVCDVSTVGEYTGLKDKKGTEIYEGDIVTFHKGYVDDTWTDTEQGKPYVIKWHSETLSYKAARESKSLTPGCGQTGSYKWTWEVVGNIYENPELTPQTV